MKSALPTKNVINSPVTALPCESQIKLILKWASSNLSKYVCVANVHMLMEAYWHQEMQAVLQNADLVTPDGMPLVWMLRLMGTPSQDRVAGMDILLGLCQQASRDKVSIFFLGSEKEILELIEARLKREFPDLKIAGMEPLPFHPLTQAEDEAVIQKLNHSGAGLVLVSLGCPKQEYWIAQHKNKINAVMIGLGAVFPVYAGLKKWAPRWIQQAGLEWLYRLVQEPRRLWRRYGKTIPPFLCLAFKQLLTEYKLSFKTKLKHQSSDATQAIDYTS